MKASLIHMADAYKWTHPFQYRPNITDWQSYAEPRVGGKVQKLQN